MSKSTGKADHGSLGVSANRRGPASWSISPKSAVLIRSAAEDPIPHPPAPEELDRQVVE